MKQFEYTQRVDITDSELQHFGRIGWELVSVTEDLNGVKRFYFKREVGWG